MAMVIRVQCTDSSTMLGQRLIVHVQEGQVGARAVWKESEAPSAPTVLDRFTSSNGVPGRAEITSEGTGARHLWLCDGLADVGHGFLEWEFSRP